MILLSVAVAANNQTSGHFLQNLMNLDSYLKEF